MFQIKVKRSNDGKFYWVMLSESGQVVCSSARHQRKLGALYSANVVRQNASNVKVIDEAIRPHKLMVKHYGY